MNTIYMPGILVESAKGYRNEIDTVLVTNLKEKNIVNN